MLGKKSPESGKQSPEEKDKILEAVKDQNIDQVRNLLAQNPLLSKSIYHDEKRNGQYSLIYYAASTGDFGICELLLGNGAVPTIGSESAMFAAVRSGNANVVQIFADCANTRSLIDWQKPVDVAKKIAIEKNIDPQQDRIYQMLLSMDMKRADSRSPSPTVVDQHDDNRNESERTPLLGPRPRIPGVKGGSSFASLTQQGVHQSKY